MKKLILTLIALAIFGANCAFAFGYPYISSTQNWANYMACSNARDNGAQRQKILAGWACETFYGVDTDDDNPPYPVP